MHIRIMRSQEGHSLRWVDVQNTTLISALWSTDVGPDNFLFFIFFILLSHIMTVQIPPFLHAFPDNVGDWILSFGEGHR